MSLFRRRPRNWSEISDDPHTPYMIGRLLGANEMAIIVLSKEDNPQAQNVAQVLDRIQGYFLEEGTMISASEQTTLVTKPSKPE